nr:uncharacterized mitochondrial protein AtMg00810-like [Tanacetum cinerariifolium]
MLCKDYILASSPMKKSRDDGDDAYLISLDLRRFCVDELSTQERKREEKTRLLGDQKMMKIRVLTQEIILVMIFQQSLLITHQANSQVKDNKIDLLVQQYEQFIILEEESIDSSFARFNTIITSLKALDEGFSSKNYVRKFLRALHPKWRAKVTAIEGLKDLSSLALDELIGNLKVHKVVMEKDSEIYRGKKERIKSIALKAKKESSDDETLTSGSDVEEYAIAVRNFKRLFRRKGKLVRQPREENKSFQQRDEKKGELNFFLGLQIKQMEDDIFFNRSKYIKEMLKKFGLVDSKPTKTSMSMKIKLTKDDEADFVDRYKYRGMIGSLLYLIVSRPDIMFSVSLCARFQENPNTTHLEIVNRIFKYIRGTSHLGLWYSKATGIETIVYADSDHAGDYVDRKSTSGICTFMGCCLTSWYAKKQTALAISTTEAEYISVGKACQQALWMKQALIDYGIHIDDVSIMESYRTLKKRLFHEGRIVTPSFISENNMLLFFQAVGLEPFLTHNEPICPRFVVEFYHSLEVKRNEEERPYIEFKLGQLGFKLTSSQLSQILQTPYALETFYASKWSLSSLDDHPNSNFFCPKHDLVKKTITTPRTAQTQLLRDSNKLYLDDIRLELKGWELFFREKLFCSLGKRNKEVKNKQDGPMPFAMLLTRLYNHILQTNPQAIVPPDRFTFHEHVMDPLNVSKNPSKEKEKKIVSSSVISSSSSSSNDNKAPSFLEFYDKLSDSEDLTKAQRDKRGVFKILNCYVSTITM